MMKTINLKTTLVFIFFLGFLNAGYAEDSASIQVSCTIPAIPGVNAPLLEKETLIINPDLGQSQITKSETATSEPLLSIQKDRSQEKVNSDGEKALVMLKTFYPR